MINGANVRIRSLILMAVLFSLSACATISLTPEDLALQKTVHKAILFAPELSSPNINVSVHEGIVYLQGFVTSGFDRWIAESTAANVEGVMRVYNHISVKD